MHIHHRTKFWSKAGLFLLGIVFVTYELVGFIRGLARLLKNRR